MKKFQGCPDVGAKPDTRDGKIWVGDGGVVGEKRHGFDSCPGFYLRHDGGFTVDGFNTPFDLSWAEHWAFDRGIEHLGADGEIPPKLKQSIRLIESEKRAREALKVQKMRQDSEASRLTSANSGKRVITG